MADRLHRTEAQPATPASRNCRYASLVALLLGCSAAFMPGLVDADVITVGAGSDCSVTSLSSALVLASSTPGDDEIRLNFTDEPDYTGVALHIRDFGDTVKGGLDFVGGFSSCSDTTAGTAKVGIAGAAGDHVFEIDTDTGDSIVSFRNLIIRDGGTGGLLIEGDSTVTLDNTEVVFNDGPGVTVTGGGQLSLGGTTGPAAIRDNVTSGFGGGIRCIGASVDASRASIGDNKADSGGGGGIYASTCSVDMGQDTFIGGNSAIDGAGIYAAQGSVVVMQGKSDGTPSLNVNTASDDGGGLYAKNSGTIVAFVNVRVEGNTAVDRGGGLFIDDGATLSMAASERACRRPGAAPPLGKRVLDSGCTRLRGNDLTSEGAGSAVYAGSDAQVTVTHAFVHKNIGPGSVIYATGSGTSVMLEALSLWDNDAIRLLEATSSATLTLAYSSAADNTHDCGASDPCNAEIAQLSGGASLDLHSSIFWPAGGVSKDAGSALAGNCLLASASTGLDGIIANTVTGMDPQFFDPSVGDLRLTGSSPAIDFCDDSAYTAIATDTETEARGQDLVGNANGDPGVTGGIFDIGFDEFVTPPDLVFKDSFGPL